MLVESPTFRVEDGWGMRIFLKEACFEPLSPMYRQGNGLLLGGCAQTGASA